MMTLFNSTILQHTLLNSFFAVLLLLGLSLNTQAAAPGGYPWQSINALANITPEQMKREWTNWHQEDLFPYPSAQALEKRIANHPELKKQLPPNMTVAQLSQRLEKAWLAFHQGQFEKAYTIAQPLGHFGTLVAIHSAYLNAYYIEADTEKRQALFSMLAAQADKALEQEPENPHITLIYCYMQGRYLEELPFKASLVSTYTKLYERLNGVIENNEKHLGARLILAGFHAEGNVKAGFLARVRFGSSSKKAKKQFEATIKDYPKSNIGHLAYAMGRKRLNEGEFDERAVKALKQAANLPASESNYYLAKQHAKQQLAKHEAAQL